MICSEIIGLECGIGGIHWETLRWKHILIGVEISSLAEEHSRHLCAVKAYLSLRVKEENSR